VAFAKKEGVGVQRKDWNERGETEGAIDAGRLQETLILFCNKGKAGGTRLDRGLGIERIGTRNREIRCIEGGLWGRVGGGWWEKGRKTYEGGGAQKRRRVRKEDSHYLSGLAFITPKEHSVTESPRLKQLGGGVKRLNKKTLSYTIQRGKRRLKTSTKWFDQITNSI